MSLVKAIEQVTNVPSEPEWVSSSSSHVIPVQFISPSLLLMVANTLAYCLCLRRLTIHPREHLVGWDLIQSIQEQVESPSTREHGDHSSLVLASRSHCTEPISDDEVGTVLLSFGGDYDLNVPRMRKDRKVVLRLMTGPAMMRAAMTMATTRL